MSELIKPDDQDKVKHWKSKPMGLDLKNRMYRITKTKNYGQYISTMLIWFTYKVNSILKPHKLVFDTLLVLPNACLMFINPQLARPSSGNNSLPTGNFYPISLKADF